jgi:stage II sporulation SpoE-like protein/GAF domain-containing protein
MTPNRRLVSATVVAIIVLAAASVAIGYRVHHWSQIGWAGLNYFPELEKRKPKVRATASGPPGTFFLESGRVVVAFPGAPGARAGIDGTDAVRSVNGIPISEVKRLDQLDRTLHTGDTITYHVKRGNVERDVRVRLEPPVNNPRMLVSMGLSILLAISFAVIGLIVFIQRPSDRRAAVFYAMAIVGALSYIGGIAISFDGSNLRGITTTPSRGLMVVFVYLAATFAFGALTLHLALIFPHDRRVLSERPYVIRWIYVIPAFAALLIGGALGLSLVANTAAEKTLEYVVGQGFPFLAGALAFAGAAVALRIAYKARAEGAKQAFLSRAIQTVFAIHAIIAAIALLLEVLGVHTWSRIVLFCGVAVPCLAMFAYPFFTFIALYRSYREAGVEEKRQVKWPLWGTMIAIAMKIFFGASSFILGILISIRLMEPTTWMGVAQGLEMVPRLFFLLIPISFAVAILKYRLMDIDVIIKKTVAYGILSGLIIAIYLVLVGGFGTVLVHVAGVRNQTMVIASTLVVALIFVPLRNRLQHLVDRNLFRQKYDYPQALRAMAAETLAATDLRSFFLFAAETLQQAAQNRSVVIFERRQDDLVVSSKVGLPDSVLGSVRMPADAAEAIDRPLDPRRRQLPEPAAAALRKVATALAVPIRSQGVLHGVIALGSKLSDREFDLEDIEFLSSAADQIAITVDRIRLQRDEEDFEQAREMQQALLPAAVPHVAGIDVSGTWKPARAVGGDYYDLLRLSDTQLAVCIGDVAGKGMPAALLMSALQAAVRASAGPDMPAAELCERVRRVIVQSLSGGRFVTFFHCTLDTAARKIRYCNAGHNPPILVRADGRTIRLDKGGPALSRLFSSTPFTQGEEELLDGDRLVLFTDGVSESRDAAGNDYGEDQLERLIADHRDEPAHDLMTTIVDTVSAFSGGRNEDDLTLVAVAFTQPA